MADKSDAMLIREFFGLRPGDKLSEFMGEYKALSSQDKSQLAEGIRNGTLTY